MSLISERRLSQALSWRGVSRLDLLSLPQHGLGSLIPDRSKARLIDSPEVSLDASALSFWIVFRHHILDPSIRKRVEASSSTPATAFVDITGQPPWIAGTIRISSASRRKLRIGLVSPRPSRRKAIRPAVKFSLKTRSASITATPPSPSLSSHSAKHRSPQFVTHLYSLVEEARNRTILNIPELNVIVNQNYPWSRTSSRIFSHSKQWTLRTPVPYPYDSRTSPTSSGSGSGSQSGQWVE